LNRVNRLFRLLAGLKKELTRLRKYFGDTDESSVPARPRERAPKKQEAK